MPERKVVDSPVVKVPSTLPDRVAVRIDGCTFLVPPGQVEGFRAHHVHDDLAPDGLDKA